MKHMEGDEGADVFLPLLIYVVIRANPPRLISNLQYVNDKQLTIVECCLKYMILLDIFLDLEVLSTLDRKQDIT